MQLSRKCTDPASAGFLLMAGAGARAITGIACPLMLVIVDLPLHEIAHSAECLGRKDSK